MIGSRVRVGKTPLVLIGVAVRVTSRSRANAPIAGLGVGGSSGKWVMRRLSIASTESERGHTATLNAHACGAGFAGGATLTALRTGASHSQQIGAVGGGTFTLVVAGLEQLRHARPGRREPRHVQQRVGACGATGVLRRSTDQHAGAVPHCEIKA